MRILFFLLFNLFFLGISFGQSFEWGLSVHPNFSDRRLIALGDITDQEIETLDSLENNRPSYSSGIFVNWQSEKLGLYLGLNYMNTGYSTLKQPIPTGHSLFGQATNLKQVYINTNIELPFVVQFIQRPNEKNAIYFNMGGAFSYNIRNTLKTVYFDGQETFSTEKETQDPTFFRKFNYAFQTGMGWKHTFDNGLAFTVEPTFVMWLKGVLINTELNRSIYSIGLRTSFTLGGYELEEGSTYY